MHVTVGLNDNMNFYGFYCYKIYVQQGLVLWTLLVVHGHVFGFERPTCEGGGSILGVHHWNDTYLGCCTSEEKCFGYELKPVAKQVAQSLKARLHTVLPMKRQKLLRYAILNILNMLLLLSYECCSYRSSRPSALLRNDEDHGPEASCCESTISVLYPLSGYSAVTGNDGNL